MRCFFFSIFFIFFLLPVFTHAQSLDTQSEQSSVDIIIEADTLVPSFYKGRSLPTAGSRVRVVAVPNTNTPLENYSYRWKVGDKVFFGGAALGEYAISFIAPSKKDVLIRVDVFTANGTVVASHQRFLRVSKPILHFYKENPLRGISRNAIEETYTLVADEINIRAEPYFMNTDIFSNNARFEWLINGGTIDNPGDNQQVLTLKKGGGNSGSFEVGFLIRNTNALTQHAEGSFMLSF